MPLHRTQTAREALQADGAPLHAEVAGGEPRLHVRCHAELGGGVLDVAQVLDRVLRHSTVPFVCVTHTSSPEVETETAARVGA